MQRALLYTVYFLLSCLLTSVLLLLRMSGHTLIQLFYLKPHACCLNSSSHIPVLAFCCTFPCSQSKSSYIFHLLAPFWYITLCSCFKAQVTEMAQLLFQATARVRLRCFHKGSCCKDKLE